MLDGHGNLDALPAIIGSAERPSASSQTHRAARTPVRSADDLWREASPDRLGSRRDGRDRAAPEGETSNILAGLRNEMESAEMNEAALRQELEAVEAGDVQLDQAEGVDRAGGATAASEPGSLSNLLKRYTEAVALRENQQPDARIISPAQMPLRAVPPELPADHRPVVRGLDLARRLPCWSSPSASARSSTRWRTSSATSGCRSSA